MKYDKQTVINNELDCWRALLQMDLEVKLHKFRNPFRNDKSPGCYLYYRQNRIFLADHGDTMYHKADIFEVVMRSQGLDFNEAVRLIVDTWLSANPGAYIYEPLKPKKKHKTFVFRLFAATRPWTDDDLADWYPIQVNDLEAENCYPAQKIYHNSYLRPNDLQCYDAPSQTYVWQVRNAVKVYFKNRPKTELRFLSTMTADSIGGNMPLNYRLPLVITKSLKDYLVLKLAGFQCRYVHCETDALPEWFVEQCKQFPLVVVLYDNDSAGHEGAQIILNQLPDNSMSIFLHTYGEDAYDWIHGHPGRGSLDAVLALKQTINHDISNYCRSAALRLSPELAAVYGLSTPQHNYSAM